MKKSLKEKLKDYGFWTGLSASIVVVCTQITACFGVKINNQIVYDVIMGICGILVAFGIVTNAPKKNKEEINKNDEIIKKNIENNSENNNL